MSGSAAFLLLAMCAVFAASTAAVNIPDPNDSQLPECPTALSRRFRWGARAGFTNPALCTIGGLPYPPTTWAPGAGSGTFTIFDPTATASGSTTSIKHFTPITTGPATVVFPSSDSGTSAPTAAPTSSINGSTNGTVTAASATTASTTNTGAGVRRAPPPHAPAGFKSIQRFSGLQIGLALFLGLAVLAGVTYMLDELLFFLDV
ncbi:hypothetical protein OC844_001064 [Tilletia horrida]|nr:hypothetical protein OC844_001064 [Tilletia horrida]